MKSIPIKEFDELLMASENFRELKKGKQSLIELVKYPWISLLPGTATRTYHEDFFADNSLDFEPQMSVATTDQVLPMMRCYRLLKLIQNYCQCIRLSLTKNVILMIV